MSKKLTQVELFNALIEYKYVVFKDGVLIVTNDFYRDFGDPTRLVVNQQIEIAAKQEIPPPPVEELSPPSSGIVHAVEIELLPTSVLSKFIIDIEIPKTAKTRSGTYALNKYNAKAEKVLQKILKDTKIQYPVLVMSTKLYYKSGVMPKTIANYFLEGIWRDEYNDLAEALKLGASNAQKYINSKKKEGTSNEEGSTRFKR